MTSCPWRAWPRPKLEVLEVGSLTAPPPGHKDETQEVSRLRQIQSPEVARLEAFSHTKQK